MGTTETTPAASATRQESAPHYLRVARALALVGGMSALGGCYSATSPEVEGDAGARRDAAPIADAGRDAGHDAGWVDACSSCVCEGWVDGGPDATGCESSGHWECCAAIGPLFPPDLPA